MKRISPTNLNNDGIAIAFVFGDGARCPKGGRFREGAQLAHFVNGTESNPSFKVGVWFDHKYFLFLLKGDPVSPPIIPHY